MAGQMLRVTSAIEAVVLGEVEVAYRSEWLCQG